VKELAQMPNTFMQSHKGKEPIHNVSDICGLKTKKPENQERKIMGRFISIACSQN